MCLIVFGINQRSDLPFVLAANRDEFHERPAVPAHFWQDSPNLLAGRDLLGQGTWLGLHRDGRIAALTNLRAAEPPHGDAPSRGTLISDFLNSGLAPHTWLASRYSDFAQFSGFNLIVADNDNVWFANNHDTAPTQLTPGIYGLSNATLDTPWEKVRQSKAALKDLLSERQRPRTADYLELLTLRDTPAATRTAALADIFVQWPEYGTRCSSIIQRNHNNQLLLTEQTWDKHGQPTTAVSIQFSTDS